MNTSAMHADHNGAADPLRVILVGRTGLDGALRRDPSIELVRAADAFDAVGELSDPIDQSSPERAVVIVGQADEPRPGVGGAEALMRALRQVDPAVRVLGVVDGLSGSPAAAYDAVVTRDADAGDVRRALATPTQRVARASQDAGSGMPLPEQGDKPHVTDAPHVSAEHAWSRPESYTALPGTKPFVPNVPEAESASEPEITVRATSVDARAPAPKSPEPRSPFVVSPEQAGVPLSGSLPESLPEPPSRAGRPGAGARDTALVQAMLSGASVLDPALDIIRSRLGVQGLRFERGAGDAEEGTPVQAGGRVFGALVGAGEREDVAGGSVAWATRVEAEANWLGGWMLLEAQRRELERAAFTDPLTGAWNRRYFERYLAAAIDQARNARLPLTVMVFDIDNFKSYNDRFGHAAGDEILTETVRLLRSMIRPSDRVCRIGGDEFAVVFYEPGGPRDPSSRPPESVGHIAERFQSQVCSHRFPKLGSSAQGTLTISGGLATYPWDGVDPPSLLGRADELALRSKAQGKNVLTFGPGAQEVCHTRAERARTHQDD